MYIGSSYRRSFGILSSQAGRGNSRCVVLELGYNPHDHFYIIGGANIRNLFAPVNDEVYRKQFLDGDDSDYNLLRFQPVVLDPHNERALVPVAGENGAKGVSCF